MFILKNNYPNFEIETITFVTDFLAMKTKKTHFVNEEEVLQKRMNLSYTERFQLLMKLIRINKMMKSAKIIHIKK